MVHPEQYKKQWLAEEAAAQMHGWDFSHLDGRYQEENDLPWDYEALVRKHLLPGHRLLDMDTGGGEFLLSLGHPYAQTSATEGYPPNIRLCQERLLPLGIDFRPADGGGPLPFADASFDRVLNRHGDYLPSQLRRVLRPGGLFLTEQVGAENDRDLVELLLPGTPMPFPRQYASLACQDLVQQGFRILSSQEALGRITFWDVGALVWFARVLPWEFPGFSVERCWPQLCRAQEIIQSQGCLCGTTHRYLILAQAPDQERPCLG